MTADGAHDVLWPLSDNKSNKARFSITHTLSLSLFRLLWGCRDKMKQPFLPRRGRNLRPVQCADADADADADFTFDTDQRNMAAAAATRSTEQKRVSVSRP